MASSGVRPQLSHWEKREEKKKNSTGVSCPEAMGSFTSASRPVLLTGGDQR